MVKEEETMKYLYIRAWGKLLGSFPYYIEGEVAKAEKENAPETAIFRREDGTWEVFEGIGYEDTKARIAAMVENMRKDNAR